LFFIDFEKINEKKKRNPCNSCNPWTKKERKSNNTIDYIYYLPRTLGDSEGRKLLLSRGISLTANTAYLVDGLYLLRHYTRNKKEWEEMGINRKFRKDLSYLLLPLMVLYSGVGAWGSSFGTRDLGLGNIQHSTFNIQHLNPTSEHPNQNPKSEI